MSIIDVIVIAAYFAILLFIGYIGSKKAKNVDDFLVAGRNLSGLQFFSTMSALLLGGTSTIGTAALGYEYGLSGIWIVMMLGLGVAFVGLFVIKRISKMKIYTVAQFLSGRYNPAAGLTSAVVSAVYAMMVCVTQIIATGTILQVVLGWDAVQSMLIAGTVTIIYTMLGGMWTITLTETIQFGLIVFGILIVLVPNALHVAGGISNIMETLPKSYFNPVGIGIPTVIKYIFLYCTGAMVGQDIWQKYFTAKNDGVARRGGIATFIFVVFYAVCCALVGMCGKMLFPEISNPQHIFASVTKGVLGTGWLGITLAGIISVLMSSAAGLLLASSSLVLNGIIRPLSKTEYTEVQILHKNRVTIIVIGVVSIFIAIKLNDVLVALDVSYAILSGALFLPIMFGIFWEKATSRAAVTSIICSSIAITAGMAVHGLSAVLPIIYGLVVGLILMISISLMDQKKPE